MCVNPPRVSRLTPPFPWGFGSGRIAAPQERFPMQVGVQFSPSRDANQTPENDNILSMFFFIFFAHGCPHVYDID